MVLKEGLITYLQKIEEEREKKDIILYNKI